MKNLSLTTSVQSRATIGGAPPLLARLLLDHCSPKIYNMKTLFTFLSILLSSLVSSPIIPLL